MVLVNIDCEIHDFTDNFIKICYVDKNISVNDIKNNKNNIESNNSKEINFIKENSSSNKQYLKNVYNILFYDEKTQIAFSNNKYFYEKVFENNHIINDFIEINFKFILEIDDISNVNYVKVRYQIFDEDNNRIYIKSVNLHDYKYFSNKIIIDEYIFYNFTKKTEKIMFNIQFQQTIYKYIEIYYIKNANHHRFILKHYGN